MGQRGKESIWVFIAMWQPIKGNKEIERERELF